MITRAMRIIAGRFKGRTILPPPSQRTRPILDRAKAVLFDMLGARLAEPGSLPSIAVLDLFAGTGTLGLEALSRGANYVQFVERDRATVRRLTANLEQLGVASAAAVTQSDATKADFPIPPTGSGSYELVFVDPPYRMFQDSAARAELLRLFRRITECSRIAPGALIVVRHEARKRQNPDLSPLLEKAAREVGHMALRLMARPDHPGWEGSEGERS